MADKKITTQVFDQTGKEVKKIDLNPAVFGVEIKESVVHQIAVAHMANSRVAIAHTKTRGEVRGGGKKPWAQKGTGRARHGSSRSPIWVGGGVTFGPRKDRNFAQKVNKKMKRKALFMCLTDKVNSDLFFVLDKLSIKEGKTKEMTSFLEGLKDVLKYEMKAKKDGRVKSSKDDNATQKAKVGKFDLKRCKLSTLVVIPEAEEKIFKAARNLENIKITRADSLNVVDLLKYKRVLFIEEGLGIVEKTYLK